VEHDKIIIVGRSNVGKSSTIRALTNKAVKVGKRPGVTLRPNIIPYKGKTLVDMPGFGFMSGISEEEQERIKDFVVRYIEDANDILFAIQIVDAKAFGEIAARWEKRGQIPLEVEMFDFLNELNLNPLVVANKIDRVKKGSRNETLDGICEFLGLAPPWDKWDSIIVPFSAKTGEGLVELKRKLTQKMSVVH
jgi:GTP-binding protein EngB required for normal cell division